MRVLIVEDDTEVSSYIKNGLKEAGHAADCADNGKDGLFLATTETYDVYIMDRMLPGLDGITIIKTLRGAGNQTPVLILSALGDIDDRVEGLRSGGDDYLVKPFAFAELLARIEVLARRVQGGTIQETHLKAGDLDMDLLARKVTRSCKNIDLQSREFRLLEYLLRHKGQVVTRTMLLENIWDYHFDPQTNVIDVHISRLRSKIDEGFEGSLIRTVRGAGYIIEG
jgi:two-component system OmpR family response regulator